MTHSDTPLTITHCRLHHLCRVGTCPVLEVTVTYPCLCPETAETGELSPAVTRFNDTYRTMAEKLAEWAQVSLYESVVAEFAAAGAGAAYRFDRRLVICDMIANGGPCEVADASGGAESPSHPETEQISELTVTRTLRLSSRRGEVAERRLTATDRWRWPELTLCPPSRRRGRTVSI